jgi:hypothetical protein
MMNASSRTHSRADLDVYVNKIIGDEPHLARVRNISEGGLYMYRLLEPETRDDAPVGLEIMLPTTREVIWAVARVVRREIDPLADGMALEFVRITESDRELIRRYVAMGEAESLHEAA